MIGIEILIYAERLCGTPGWSWSIRRAGHDLRSGWTGGERVLALRDAHEAMRKLTASEVQP